MRKKRTENEENQNKYSTEHEVNVIRSTNTK